MSNDPRASARCPLPIKVALSPKSNERLRQRIDREKAKSLHVPLSQITDTLGVYMGSSYVNDFIFSNRSYRVYVQADKQFRSEAKDMKQYYVRSDSGAMVPLDNLISITQTTTPQVISHYNLFRSAEIDGSASPGYSSGQAIAGMEPLSKKLPQGFSYSWTGLSLEELQAGGTSLILFGMGTLVVYLTLSAQYESFVLPFIVLLAVPMALLGALGAQWTRGLQNDVFCQVGLVMLVGLSSNLIRSWIANFFYFPLNPICETSSIQTSWRSVIPCPFNSTVHCRA